MFSETENFFCKLVSILYSFYLEKNAVQVHRYYTCHLHPR